MPNNDKNISRNIIFDMGEEMEKNLELCKEFSEVVESQITENISKIKLL